MHELIELIKDKKDLRSISENYVEKQLKAYFKENSVILKKCKESKTLKQFTKSREYKEMLKEVRSKLREVYGAFIMKEYSKIGKTLEELKKEKKIKYNDQILNMHRSSRERLPYYREAYKEILEMTGKPKKILDLACGLNPFAYPYLDCEPEYLCSDISPEICSYIQEYFDSQNIKGTAFMFDLLDFKENSMSDYAQVDVCFLFKALDSLETIQRNFSEKLVKGIKTRFLVVSFATQSLGGSKKIHQDRRKWFEKIIEKNGYKYDLFFIPNEVFYIVDKASE